MFAFKIVTIVFLGIITGLNLILTVGAEDEIKGLGFVNLIPAIMAIVALSVSL